MSERSEYCARKASQCAAAATHMSDRELRGQLMDLSHQWRGLAEQIALMDAQPGIQIGTGNSRM